MKVGISLLDRYIRPTRRALRKSDGLWRCSVSDHYICFKSGSPGVAGGSFFSYRVERYYYMERFKILLS